MELNNQDKYLKKLSLQELKEIRDKILEEQVILYKEYTIVRKEINLRLLDLYEDK
jgi:hypothetical protein